MNSVLQVRTRTRLCTHPQGVSQTARVHLRLPLMTPPLPYRIAPLGWRRRSLLPTSYAPPFRPALFPPSSRRRLRMPQVICSCSSPSWPTGSPRTAMPLAMSPSSRCVCSLACSKRSWARDTPSSPRRASRTRRSISAISSGCSSGWNARRGPRCSRPSRRCSPSPKRSASRWTGWLATRRPTASRSSSCPSTSPTLPIRAR